MDGHHAASRRCWRRRAVFATSMILFLSVSALHLLTKSSQLWRSENGTFTLQDEPGVGFDLTASYGTAVIRYRNGTDDAHIYLDGDREYRELMHRLSLDSSRHLAPLYGNGGEWYDDQPRQWWRRARKLLGFPASRDVGILSRILGPLRERVEERLGRKVSSAVVTSSNIVALYAEDITDAMEYTGLKPPYLKGSSDLSQPREVSTAQAGYGVGLCAHYKDYDQCESEERQMPVRRFLTVLFTRSALLLYKAASKEALEFYEPPSFGRADFHLGSDAIHSNPKEEYYWEDVRNTVLEVLLRYGGERDPVTQVFMLGESALNSKFLEVVNSSISAIYEERPEFFLSDPMFAAAKGAAEFAIRAPWSLPSHWANRANIGQAGSADL